MYPRRHTDKIRRPADITEGLMAALNTIPTLQHSTDPRHTLSYLTEVSLTTKTALSLCERHDALTSIRNLHDTYQDVNGTDATDDVKDADTAIKACEQTLAVTLLELDHLLDRGGFGDPMRLRMTYADERTLKKNLSDFSARYRRDGLERLQSDAPAYTIDLTHHASDMPIEGDA